MSVILRSTQPWLSKRYLASHPPPTPCHHHLFPPVSPSPFSAPFPYASTTIHTLHVGAGVEFQQIAANMPWWIPLVMPTATFIHSKLPPLPGFAPVVEIEDEEYILVEHDAYAGTVDKVEQKPEPEGTDEVLEEEHRKEERKKEERRRDSGIDVEPKSRRQPSKEEAALATLVDRIDKEIVENQEDPFNWQWFGEADLRNRDIYIYNKRRLLIETKLKTAAEAKHFMPLGRDTTKIDMELRALDMARQQLDRHFIAKYDYIPPRETWAGVEQENTDDSGRRAIIKGVIRAAYGVNVPFL